jgi:hypothetical protein
LFSSSIEANIQSRLWIKAFEDVLHNAQRCQIKAPISIEGIQGVSISAFVLLNMEGFSRRCKSLFNIVFMLARELGLHLIDHPANAKSAHTVDAEIGRRVFWYIVASDWFVSNPCHNLHQQLFRIAPSKFSGSTQGIYYCHPRHMLVNRPLNANDEDLVDGMVNIEQPLSRPTTMSYSLLRIRLSEISRHLVDRSPPLMALLGPPSHDIIMEIDTELQVLLNDIPSFFSLSKDELIATFKLAPSRAADIEHQGFMFRSLFWAQRCTLHFPYFSRGYMEPAYAPSKELCLLSAREVIHAEAKIGEIGPRATRYKFLGLLVATFVASIIVLMELCHNKSSSQNEQHRTEIADAIRILESARHESETAAKFLDSLMQVMRKHKVLPPKDAEQGSVSIAGSQHVFPMSFGMNSQTGHSFQPYEEPNLALSGVLCSNDTTIVDTMESTFENGEDLSTYYRELAQTFEQGMDAGIFDWNDLFSGIDPSVI